MWCYFGVALVPTRRYCDRVTVQLLHDAVSAIRPKKKISLFALNWISKIGSVGREKFFFFFLAVFFSRFSGTKCWIYRIYMFVIHSASGNKDTNNIFKVQISFVSFLVLFKITIWAVSLQSDEANMTGIENAQCWHWHTLVHIPPVTFRCTYLYSLKYKTICFYI